MISDWLFQALAVIVLLSYFLYCSSLSGLQVEFNRGEAYAVKTDIECTNGHIHIIDGVLTPQEGTVIPKK